MSLTYTINLSLGIVAVDYIGKATSSEWNSTMKAVFANPRYRPGLGFVFDRRTVSPADPAYIRRVVQFIDGHESDLKGCRFAVVVSDQPNLGMTRMAQVMASQSLVPIEIFLDMDAAISWARQTRD